MSSDDSGSGLMSSAGLVRYFDAEDRNAIHIDPRTVMAWAALFGVLVQVLNAVQIGGESTSSLVISGVVVAFLGFTVGLIVRAATQGET